MKAVIFIILFCIVGACGQKNSENDQVEIITTSEPQPTIEDIKTEEPKPIGKGKITTMADGIDVQRVNLWSTTGSNRITTSHLIHGEKVIVLREEGPYYLIETVNVDGRKGYCMKEFVNMGN